MTTTTKNETSETYTRHELEVREGLKPDGVWVRAGAVKFDRAQDLTDYRDRANAIHPGCWRLLLVESKTIVNTTNIETITLVP